MNRRIFALAAATVAALVPAICNATPETEAINACARAFASSLAAPGAAAPPYQVTYRGDRDAGSVAWYFTREYSFELRANDKKTGLPIARARCDADGKGAVVALKPRPLEAVQPAMASRL
jgi:hypothetical protein